MAIIDGSVLSNFFFIPFACFLSKMETVYDDKDILKNMQETFGFQSYMSFEQEKSVKAVLRGDKNIIVSMPTSSGKSLCFYLPSKFTQNIIDKN